MSETVKLHIAITAMPQAARVPVTVPKDATSSDLRKLASEATKIPLQKMRLICRGRIISDKDDNKVIEEFKLEDGSALHAMGQPEGSAGSTQAAAQTNAPVAAPAGSSVTIQPTGTSNNTTASAPASASSNSLQQALNTLRASNSPQAYMTAVTTLEKILNNIVSNPADEKYRKVKRENAAFQKRLGGLTGGNSAMTAAGFVTETQDGEEVFILHASAEKWNVVTAAKTTVEAAVRDAKAASNQSGPPAAVSMPNIGGTGGAGIDSAMGAGMPDVQNAAARMMQDPQALQAMLQNPMVREMMRSDPRFANNPQALQQLEQLAGNPAMLQQISTMMRDPNVQRQVQQMNPTMANPDFQRQMQQMQAMAPMFQAMAGMQGGVMPPLFGGSAANSTGGQQQQARSNVTGANDQELTEEEMIAEAIRRSLEEGGS